MKKIEVTLGGHTYTDVEVRFSSYLDPELLSGPASTAILLNVDDGWGLEPLATATVNVSAYGYVPRPGSVFIKDYGENEGMLESLIRAGIVEDTGRRVRGGYVEFVEAKLIGEAATEAHEALVKFGRVAG